jgi:peptidylprolyl isomerase
MWSRKPLVVVLALLIVVLGVLTNKLNTFTTGGHSHEDEQEHVSEAPKKSDIEKLKKVPKYKPIDIKMVTTPSGLKIQEIRVGTGPSPKKGDTVVVKYTGWKPSGMPFDSCDVPGMQPLEFPLGEGKVIKGWDEGIRTMKVGGKRRLTVPPELAYGEAGYVPMIEPNLTLTFDVELLSIKRRT